MTQTPIGAALIRALAQRGYSLGDASAADYRRREAALRAYFTRAREAQLAGDAIETKNWYQHAEHYLRVMRGEGHERRD